MKPRVAALSRRIRRAVGRPTMADLPWTIVVQAHGRTVICPRGQGLAGPDFALLVPSGIAQYLVDLHNRSLARRRKAR